MKATLQDLLAMSDAELTDRSARLICESAVCDVYDTHEMCWTESRKRFDPLHDLNDAWALGMRGEWVFLMNAIEVHVFCLSDWESGKPKAFLLAATIFNETTHPLNFRTPERACRGIVIASLLAAGVEL